MVRGMNISRSLALTLAALSVAALLFGAALAGFVESGHKVSAVSDMDQVQGCLDTTSCDAVTDCPAHCSVVNGPATETISGPGTSSSAPSSVGLALVSSLTSLHKPPPRLGLLS
jgi:hypothetical protein